MALYFSHPLSAYSFAIWAHGVFGEVSTFRHLTAYSVCSMADGLPSAESIQCYGQFPNPLGHHSL